MIHHTSVPVDHSALPGALFHLCIQQENTILLRVANLMFWKHQEASEVLTHHYLASAHLDPWAVEGVTLHNGQSQQGPCSWHGSGPAPSTP